MKKRMSILLSVMIGLTMLTQNSYAKGKGHSHGRTVVYKSNHWHGHVNRVYVPRVVYRPVYYRPYYGPGVLVPHYHYGFYEPCYDQLHTTGVYWNVSVGTGGVGVGFQTGW